VVVGAVVTFLDITERKKAEVAIAESEKKFRAVFDAAKDGMIVADLETHRFTMVNAAIQKQTGYTESDLLNFSVSDLHPPADLPYVVGQFEKQARREIDGAPDMPVLRKDGTVFFADVNASGFTLKGRQYMLGIFRDVTERKKMEGTLQGALAEKEVLMLEIHHRVKNNLAVIISLLGMQAESIHDEQTLATIRDMQGRIAIMAQVHRSLYDSKNVSQINFGEFIKTLADRQMQSLGGKHPIEIRIEGENPAVSLDIAIPAGLIVNELVTNVIKHAFPGGHPPPGRADEPCRITIVFQLKDDEYTLVVSDNGIGIPPDFDWRSTRSLGLRLVNILTRHQLRGSVDMNTRQGTEFVLKFKDPKKRSEPP
jgi:PAS domain S-box-containing protein